MWFNNRGPVPVSEAIFQTYRELIPSGRKLKFKILFDIWTDENYDPALRRLGLRDMLWQTSGKLCDSNAYYYMTEAPSHTAMFKYASPTGDEQDGRERLAASLRLRPTLLNELIEEFLWAPTEEEEHNYRVYQRTSGQEDEMIEFLLPLVSELRGKELWQHHRGFTSTSYTFNLEVWLRVAHPPIWFDQMLRTTIYQTLRQEISDNSNTLSSICQFDELPHSEYSGLSLFGKVIDFLNSYKHDTDQKDLKPFIELVRMLEDLLPSDDFAYLLPLTFFVVLPELEDPELILTILRRHLPYLGPVIFRFTQRGARNFLFWLSGVVNRYAKDYAEIMSYLNPLIKRAVQFPEEFAPDPRPIARSEQPLNY